MLEKKKKKESLSEYLRYWKVQVPRGNMKIYFIRSLLLFKYDHVALLDSTHVSSYVLHAIETEWKTERH
jgi:hypothetical protein